MKEISHFATWQFFVSRIINFGRLGGPLDEMVAFFWTPHCVIIPRCNLASCYLIRDTRFWDVGFFNFQSERFLSAFAECSKNILDRQPCIKNFKHDRIRRMFLLPSFDDFIDSVWVRHSHKVTTAASSFVFFCPRFKRISTCRTKQLQPAAGSAGWLMNLSASPFGFLRNHGLYLIYSEDM